MTPEKFFYKGYEFEFDGEFLYAPPGVLHPKYVVYVRIDKTRDEGSIPISLLEAKKVIAADTMIIRSEKWSKECDERGCLPPGIRMAND